MGFVSVSLSLGPPVPIVRSDQNRYIGTERVQTRNGTSVSYFRGFREHGVDSLSIRSEVPFTNPHGSEFSVAPLQGYGLVSVVLFRSKVCFGPDVPMTMIRLPRHGRRLVFLFLKVPKQSYRVTSDLTLTVGGSREMGNTSRRGEDRCPESPIRSLSSYIM